MKVLRYPHRISTERLQAGDPRELLPIMNHAVIVFSSLLARWINQKGYQLALKADLPFVESVFQLMRREFVYRPVLTPAQFLQPTGFAEQKLILVGDLIRLCKKKHNELYREEHPNAVRTHGEHPRTSGDLSKPAGQSSSTRRFA